MYVSLFPDWDRISDCHFVLVPETATKVNYKLPGFFAKFLELQQVMWTTNAGLTDRHTYDSRPESWPLLRRGIVSIQMSIPGRFADALPIRISG